MHRSRNAAPRVSDAILALLVGLAAAAPGGALPDHPPFVPTRDVSVVYRLKSPDPAQAGGKSSEELHFYATAGGRRMRLDTPGTGGTLLIDPEDRTATVVDPGLHAFMTVPLNPTVARGLLLLDPGAAFTRGAEAKVAGLACTVWALGPAGSQGSACVTKDGVVLRRSEGTAAGEQSELSALTVTYAPQPLGLFAPPHGYQDLSSAKAPAPPPPPPEPHLQPPAPPSGVLAPSGAAAPQGAAGAGSR